MSLGKKLQNNSTIRLIAPSNIIGERKTNYDLAKTWLEAQGFTIQYSKNAFSKDKFGVSGGTKEERAQDLNEAFADPSVDMVWCMCGGDTAQELLPLIDFENIKNHPKPFLGHSDIDVLHLAINKNTNLTTFMAADPNKGFNRNLDIPYIQKAFQERFVNNSKLITPAGERKTIRSGTAEGKMLGCNIGSILKLAGTPYFPDFKESILFLEGYRVSTRKAIARLTQLKNIGVFDQIKGIVTGHMVSFDTDMKTQLENTVTFEEIVSEITKEYTFPILKINEFGHHCNHAFIPVGAKVKIDADKKTVEIVEDFLQ
jgi:muramoyltetrapeptide carboxypeptidase